MELTISRLEYILYIAGAPSQECTVTNMAKRFGVSKSTISRNMDYLAAQGVVYADRPELTGHGRRIADQYEEEVTTFEEWITGTVSCGEEEDRRNAMEMAVHLSSDVKEKIFSTLHMRNMIKELDHSGTIGVEEFADRLKDGRYNVGFAVLREKFEPEKYFSMADRGFSHPAVLEKKGSTAFFQFHAVTMEQKNMMDRLINAGKLLRLDYLDHGEFIPVSKNGDLYQIPAGAFEYVHHQGENLLLGSLLIQIYAPMGRKKMHQKRAVLCVIISTW